MYRRFALSLAALTFAALLLAACGGGDGGDSPISVATRTAGGASATPAAGDGGTGPPRASRSPAGTPTPEPFAATCGKGGAVAAAHTEEGRFISPGPPAPPGPLGTAASQPDAGLLETIRVALGDDAAAFGVVVVNLADGRYAELNPDRQFYAASLFKLTVLYEVFRQRELGRLPFDEKLLYTPFYEQYDLGVAPMDVCSEPAVGDAVTAMITISENVSAVLLQDRVGAAAVNQDMAALGLRATTLAPEGVSTTPHDMALLLEGIARGSAVSSGASGEMLDLLLRQQVRERLPAGVPAGVAVGNKTGDWPGATHDVAVVLAPFGTYVIAALSEQPSAAPFVALSAAVYRYFETGEAPVAPSPAAATP